MLSSESLKKKKPKLPAPNMLDYGIANYKDSIVRVSYVLMEEMPGRPWNQQGPRGKRFADDEEKERL